MDSLRSRGLRLALIAVCWLSPAALAAPSAAASEPAPVLDQAEEAAALERLQKQIERLQRATWRRQSLMGSGRTRLRGNPAAHPSLLAYELWLRDAWRARAAKVHKRFRRPPHLAAWRCIHRYEGSWRDPSPLYYGGLQMDIAFQRKYGRGLLRRKGTANNWTPPEQMWVAERALRAGRGYYPWPVTARLCGLL